jgi:hypothetical protein
VSIRAWFEHARARLRQASLHDVSREWPLALAVLAGAALRLDQIGIQIPLDDEWHALHAVERFGYGHVLTHFGWTDYCIPLTVFYKAVSDVWGLSELWLRLPVLVAGVLSLVIMPIAVRPWVGGDAAAVFAWLLAVSPLHVYFSRYARPYSVALLLTFVAVFALLHVRFLGRRGWAWAYVAAAALSPYFHLTTLPVVLLPLAVALLGRLLGDRAKGWSLPRRGLWIVGVGVGLGLLAFIGPPLFVDHRALFYKTGRGSVDASTLAGAAQLIAGSARPGALVFLSLAALAGLVALARRRPALAAYLAVVAGVAIAVPLLGHPVLIELPIVLTRYCLVLLPLLLVLVSCGCISAAALLGARGPAVAGVMGPALAGLLFWLGPLAQTHRHPNAWTNHPAFQYSYATAPCDSNMKVPPVYEWLARFPAGSQRVVEAPWLFAAPGIRFHCYQRVHRQDMLIGFVGGVFDAISASGLPRPGELPVLARPTKYRFRSFVHLAAHADLPRRGVRFVILHKAIEREMTGAQAGTGLGIEPWIKRYRDLYGPPVHEDAVTAAFDVAPVAENTPGISWRP